MAAAPLPQPAAPTPPAPKTVLTAWTPPAQLATAFLLGVAVTLIATRWYGSSRWGARQTQLEQPSRPAYRVDLNRAERAELLQLPGVGEGLVRHIEGYRQAHGRFQRVDDLVMVNGIGPATLERLRPWVCVHQEDGGEESRPYARGRRRRSSSAIKTTASARRLPSQKAAGLKGPININEASATELQRLPGVGRVISGRIVDERRQRPFQSADDLRRVSGIGPKKLEALRPYVTVDSEPVRVVTRKPREPQMNADPR